MEKTGGRTYDIVDWIEGFFFFFFFLFFSLVVSPEQKHNTHPPFALPGGCRSQGVRQIESCGS